MLEKEGEKGVGKSGECLESEENGEQVVRVEDELWKNLAMWYLLMDDG